MTNETKMPDLHESLPLDEKALDLLRYIVEARSRGVDLSKDMEAFENVYQVAKAFERESLIMLNLVIGLVSQHCSDFPGPDPIYTNALSANEDAIFALEQRKFLERYKGKAERWFWTERAKTLEMPR